MDTPPGGAIHTYRTGRPTLGLLAHGATEAEILGEYVGVAHEDIQACLLFAAQSLHSTLFMPLVPETA